MRERLPGLISQAADITNFRSRRSLRWGSTTKARNKVDLVAIELINGWRKREDQEVWSHGCLWNKWKQEFNSFQIFWIGWDLWGATLIVIAYLKSFSQIKLGETDRFGLYFSIAHATLGVSTLVGSDCIHPRTLLWIFSWVDLFCMRENTTPE